MLVNPVPAIEKSGRMVLAKLPLAWMSNSSVSVETKRVPGIVTVYWPVPKAVFRAAWRALWSVAAVPVYATDPTEMLWPATDMVRVKVPAVVPVGNWSHCTWDVLALLPAVTVPCSTLVMPT